MEPTDTNSVLLGVRFGAGLAHVRVTDLTGQTVLDVTSRNAALSNATWCSCRVGKHESLSASKAGSILNTIQTVRNTIIAI